MTERAAFGLELQRTRERRDLSLDQLAECTKISASLFAGLERGDLSRWPTGIFRRAFVRGYAQAVGLDPEETVARFLRVYPDADGEAPLTQPPVEPAGVAADGPMPRLMLDEAEAPAPETRGVIIVRRVAAPLLDTLLAVVPGLVVAALFGREWFWLVAGAVGLFGHLLLFSLLGTTPGAWLLWPRPAARIPIPESPTQARRRVEAEAPAAAGPRRRQPRHASVTRPVAGSRTRRVQH